jgi:exoribonuclease R
MGLCCCSETDRFAVSVLWELTPGYNIIPEKTWMGRTVIRSRHALTYYQVWRFVVVMM